MEPYALYHGELQVLFMNFFLTYEYQYIIEKDITKTVA